MTNRNILTTLAKTIQCEKIYYSPVTVLPSNVGAPLESIYCFLSKVEPWPNESDPPEPGTSVKDIKQTFKNIFAAKKIGSSDISPVLQRVDWTSGIVYDFYRDDIDMLELDSNGRLVHKFYVKNRYDQVFKCLWNNKGEPSVDEPVFEPGSYGVNNIYTGPNDGYKWKYIYTVDLGLKIKFMDESWMPVTIGTNTANPLLSSTGTGSIDVIHLYEGGSGYDPGNSVISVVITGDGTGAAANVSVSNGAITQITMTSVGSNYTFANISVVSSSGSGVVAYANTSPVGGHGFDPISELGCTHVMFSAEFNGSENNTLPVDVDFRQIGIVVNPTTSGLSPKLANGNIYRTTTDLLVAPGFGVFEEDEIVYQGSSLQNATFQARVLSFNTSTNVLYVINKIGTPTLYAPLIGNTSSITRTLLSSTNPDFTLLSGYIIFIENRAGVERSSDGIEQIRFVLGF